MSLVENYFLPREDQNLALARNLGDALAVVAEKLWPHNTAKLAQKAWDLDPTTAKNLTKGVVGAVVVTRAVKAQQTKHGNAWALWDALGELIIGQSRSAWIAECLAKEEARLDQERLQFAAELALAGQMAREGVAIFGVGHNSLRRSHLAGLGQADQSDRALVPADNAAAVAEPKNFAPHRRRD